MNNEVRIAAKVKGMKIDHKTVKAFSNESGQEEYIDIKIGKLTLEFDADTVNAQELAELINNRAIGIRLDGQQRMELP
ncbi:MAG TPA: hypothetical protein VNL15_06220 [Dehalococcoidia bacterium]|nr:hypothetical protein [Dehalococcoidia bacterium]